MVILETTRRLGALLPVPSAYSFGLSSGGGGVAVCIGVASLPEFQESALQIIGDALKGVTLGDLLIAPDFLTHPLESLLVRPIPSAHLVQFHEILSTSGLKIALNSGLVVPILERHGARIFEGACAFAAVSKVSGRQTIRADIGRGKAKAVERRFTALRETLAFTELVSNHFEEAASAVSEELIGRGILPRSSFTRNTFTGLPIHPKESRRLSRRAMGSRLGKDTSRETVDKPLRLRFLSSSPDTESLPAPRISAGDPKSPSKSSDDIHLQQVLYPSSRLQPGEPGPAEVLRLAFAAMDDESPEAIAVSLLIFAWCHPAVIAQATIRPMGTGYILETPAALPNRAVADLAFHRSAQAIFSRPILESMAQNYLESKSEIEKLHLRQIEKWIRSKFPDIRLGGLLSFLKHRGPELLGYPAILAYHGLNHSRDKGYSGWSYTHADNEMWKLALPHWQRLCPSFDLPEGVVTGWGTGFAPTRDVMRQFVSCFHNLLQEEKIPSDLDEQLALHNATAACLCLLAQLLTGTRNLRYVPSHEEAFTSFSGFEIDTQKEAHAWVAPPVLKAYVQRFETWRNRLLGPLLSANPIMKTTPFAPAMCDKERRLMIAGSHPSDIRRYLAGYPLTACFARLHAHAIRAFSNTELRASGRFQEGEIQSFFGHRLSSFGAFRKIRLELPVQRDLIHRVADFLQDLIGLQCPL